VDRAERAVLHMLEAAVDGAQITPDDVALAVSELHDAPGGKKLPVPKILLRGAGTTELAPELIQPSSP